LNTLCDMGIQQINSAVESNDSVLSPAVGSPRSQAHPRGGVSEEHATGRELVTPGALPLESLDSPA
ncbi:MAG: hypothetical protein ACM34H_11210, partial [Deltaproteobacteria bacterium]